jgi:Raf kinase inhibitor-like YbhB/YbcL family protein
MRALIALALLMSPAAAPHPAAAADGPTIALSSSAFAAGAPIPPRYSAEGGNHSPPLAWAAVAGAKAYALILRDPDAPSGTFTHWLVWNLPGAATGLPEDGIAGMTAGINDARRVGYFGPMPPYGTHHYHFQLIALDAPLALPAGADLNHLNAAMKGHVLAKGELVGTFRK